MPHHKGKDHVADQKYDIDGKSIISGIKDHGGDQDGQKHDFEDDDTFGDTDHAEEKPRYRIALTLVVIWP